MTMGRKRQRCTTADDLPSDLLDVILERLPLRDAARASVLSVVWGRAWRRLSDLATTSARDGRKAIDAVLQQHSGPVRRARFKVTDANLPVVRRWMLSLSQQPEGLQALYLAFCTSGPPPPVPEHCIFAPACTRALRDLVLASCVLPPIPASFAVGAGFPSLTRLRLTLVRVHEGSDLEAMVSMSPKLEELVIQFIATELGDDGRRRRHELQMASQSLRFLEMSESQDIDWVAVCLPRMEHARLLDVDPASATNILRGMASSVHKLVYRNYYPKTELSKGLPSSYANLNRLELQVKFSYAPEITSMFYFLKSAPNLIQLVVNDLFTHESSEDPYHWPPLRSYEICPNLRCLHIRALSLLRDALDFMRWVLSSARMLQILEVGTAKKTGNQQIADEIRRYDRVSQGVQIRVIKAYSM